MRLEHHLVGGYVRYISPHIIIIINHISVIDFNIDSNPLPRDSASDEAGC